MKIVAAISMNVVTPGRFALITGHDPLPPAYGPLPTRTGDA
jgi:hypothetical protein